MTKEQIQQRTMVMNVETLNLDDDGDEESYIVEGYAAKYKPYLLYEYDGNKIYEEVRREAFNGVDLSDVILQYDHAGKVYARGSNGTLHLSLDDVGLKIRADLSRSEGARELYEEIKSGLVTKMSWRFSVEEDELDRKTMTRVIKKIKRVYDVSAVSTPANDDTNINARNLYHTLAEQDIEDIQKRKKLKLKIKSML